MDDLTNEQKVMFYTIYWMEELKKKGLMIGGNTEITAKGKILAKELMDSGYRPTPEELGEAIKILTSPPQ